MCKIGHGAAIRRATLFECSCRNKKSGGKAGGEQKETHDDGSRLQELLRVPDPRFEVIAFN